jgi:hypothetical protein
MLVEGGDGGAVVLDPTNPNNVYHDYPYAGFFLRKSTDGGITWSTAQNGIPAGLSFNFVAPLVLDPNAPTRLLFGMSDLLESNDGANSWHVLSMPFVNGWNTNANVSAIGIANDSSVIYASTDDGKTFVTQDHGNTWTERDFPIQSTSAFHPAINEIAVNPISPNIAYAVVPTFTGSSAGHVFQTTDYGAHWVDISGNLPDVPVWSVLLDPRHPNVLYVGGDNGVWQTTALGSGNISWHKFGTGMPNAQVTEMILDLPRNSITASTYGRGMFRVLLGKPGAPSGGFTPSATPHAPAAPWRASAGPSSQEAVAAGPTSGRGVFPETLLMPLVTAAGDGFLPAGDGASGGLGAIFALAPPSSAAPVNSSALPNNGGAGSTSRPGESVVSGPLAGLSLGNGLPTSALALTGVRSAVWKHKANTSNRLDPQAVDVLFASLAE